MLVSGSTITKYYMAGASRVAMSVKGTVCYLLSDQLGSTTITTNSRGGFVSELRYKPWGEIRYPTSGQNPGPSNYTYTGQYSNMGDFGLYFYNARWYDPALGRFAQADTDVPASQGVQAWDRYAYGNNSPMVYSDPSGHSSCVGHHNGDGPDCAQKKWSDVYKEIERNRYQDECGAGRRQGCQGGTKGMLAWFAGGVLTAGTADYVALGGAGGDAV